MNKSIRELLKEAHNHGFLHSTAGLDWSMEKSFIEFLKQNNIPLISSEEIKQQEAAKAQQLINEGFSLREIASILNYTHPESIRKLIKLHGGQYKKRGYKRAKA